MGSWAFIEEEMRISRWCRAHGQGEEEAKCACSSSTSKLPLRISDLQQRCRSTRFYHKMGGVKTLWLFAVMGQG